MWGQGADIDCTALASILIDIETDRIPILRIMKWINPMGAFENIVHYYKGGIKKWQISP